MAFDTAFDRLIGNEGGYSNNPDDPGGETMWGVTARVARAVGYTGPMRDLPRDLAKTICRQLYWNPLRLDELPEQIGFHVLDANYNGGHAVLWMQQAAGAKADGKLGPATIAAVQACNPYLFILKFTALRGLYMTNLKTWVSFGKGWARRLFTNQLGVA